MFCQDCGFKNDDDAKFCEFCGSTLKREEKPKESKAEKTNDVAVTNPWGNKPENTVGNNNGYNTGANTALDPFADSGDKWNTNQNSFNQNSYNQEYKSSSYKDPHFIGFIILSLLIPLAGLILFFTRKAEYPSQAKVYLIVAIISFIVSFIINSILLDYLVQLLASGLTEYAFLI